MDCVIYSTLEAKREKKQPTPLYLSNRGGGSKMFKEHNFHQFYFILKVKTRKVKVVHEAYVVSTSCRDFDILLVSSLPIFLGQLENRHCIDRFGQSALGCQKGYY